MEFTSPRTALQEALVQVARAISSRAQTPTLQSVLFEVNDGVLTLTGSDLETTIRTKVNVTQSKNGSVLVPGRLIADWLRRLSTDSVRFVLDSSVLKVESGKSRSKFLTIASSNWPKLPSVGDKGVLVSGSELATALAKVAKTAAVQGRNPQMCGVLFHSTDDALVLAATDSFRLCEVKLTGVTTGFDSDAIVPARSVSEVARAAAGAEKVLVSIDESKTSIGFKVDNLEIISGLIAGQFPPYERLFPTDAPLKFEIDTAQATAAIGRLLLVSSDNRGVRFKITKDTAVLSSHSTDRGESDEELSIDYEGEELVFAANGEYLAAAFDATDAQLATVRLTDAAKPIVITAKDGGNTRYLVMPVRV